MNAMTANVGEAPESEASMAVLDRLFGTEGAMLQWLRVGPPASAPSKGVASSAQKERGGWSFRLARPGEGPTPLAVGQRIVLARLRRGWTQGDLAEAADMRRPNVSRLEHGRHSPNLETLGRVATALGVGLDWLVKPWTTPPPASEDWLAEAGMDDWAGQLEGYDRD